MSIRITLQLEGLAILGASVFILFHELSASLWIIPILFLGPDVFMAGYLANEKVGALIYNVGHTLFITLPVAIAGYYFDIRWLCIAGLIFTGHIGMDRMLGYGLKYPEGFKFTHLARV
jgi:hypothetical protein